MRRPARPRATAPAAAVRPAPVTFAVVRFAAGALLSASAVPAAAQAPITFAEYASPVTTEYAATIGRPVTAGGFDFFASRGRNALGTWGTDAAADPDGALNLPTNRGASTALYATLGGNVIDMFVAGQYFNQVTTFDLFAIDVAHLYAQSSLPFGAALQPISLSFFGFQVAGADATISQTFNVGVPASGAPALNRLAFDARWRGLYQVAWQQSTVGLGSTHQFTNVAAAVVPEPATAALVGAGLAAVGAGVRRARRRRAG